MSERRRVTCMNDSVIATVGFIVVGILPDILRSTDSALRCGIPAVFADLSAT